MYAGYNTVCVGKMTIDVFGKDMEIKGDEVSKFDSVDG
jgi:hypothetical protein